jgi:hypothetical protein
VIEQDGDGLLAQFNNHFHGVRVEELVVGRGRRSDTIATSSLRMNLSFHLQYSQPKTDIDQEQKTAIQNILA